MKKGLKAMRALEQGKPKKAIRKFNKVSKKDRKSIKLSERDQFAKSVYDSVKRQKNK